MNTNEQDNAVTKLLIDGALIFAGVAVACLAVGFILARFL